MAHLSAADFTGHEYESSEDSDHDHDPIVRDNFDSASDDSDHDYAPTAPDRYDLAPENYRYRLPALPYAQRQLRIHSAPAVRDLFPSQSPARRYLAVLANRLTTPHHGSYLVPRVLQGIVGIDSLSNEGTRYAPHGDCTRSPYVPVPGPSYWVDPGNGDVYWDIPRNSPSYDLKDGYEFAVPGNPSHAPGKAALGRRTGRDILQHLADCGSLPPHEFRIYEIALRQNIHSPIPDLPIRHGWYFHPSAEDGSWDLHTGNQGVEHYLTTNLLRRHEATREPEVHRQHHVDDPHVCSRRGRSALPRQLLLARV